MKKKHVLEGIHRLLIFLCILLLIYNQNQQLDDLKQLRVRALRNKIFRKVVNSFSIFPLFKDLENNILLTLLSKRKAK